MSSEMMHIEIVIENLKQMEKETERILLVDQELTSRLVYFLKNPNDVENRSQIEALKEQLYTLTTKKKEIKNQKNEKSEKNRCVRLNPQICIMNSNNMWFGIKLKLKAHCKIPYCILAPCYWKLEHLTLSNLFSISFLFDKPHCHYRWFPWIEPKI